MKRWILRKLAAWVLAPALGELAADIEKTLIQRERRTGRPLQFRTRA